MFCREVNPPHLAYCRRCGRPLKPQTILNELDQAHRVNEELGDVKAKLAKLEATTEKLLKALTLYLGPAAAKMAAEEGLSPIMEKIKKEYEQ
jgi:hypothetical protein